MNHETTEKLVLIGAGSAMFTRGLLADILQRGWRAELGLVDTDPAALATAEGLARKMIAARGAPVELSASTDRRDVLSGATVVICTIGVGGRRAWEKDVLIPRAHGIYQPVGDTVMPGGASRALRMIPPMVEIARDVMDLAPEALFFNYGNPVGPVCRGVRKATGAKLVGLCHGVNQVAGFLAGKLGVATADLDYTAIGVNHLTWFTEVRAGGRDAMGRLREIAAEELATGEDSPFSWQLLERFGAFPAVMDRHVMEFFPSLFKGEGSYYGQTAGVEAFSFEKTIELGDEIYARMQADAEGDGPLPADYFDGIGGEHEQVIEIIECIRDNRGEVFSANLPNAGQVPNLPPEAIVESPAVAGAGGLEPLPQKPLPAGIAATLAGHFAWVETVVGAALEGSRDKFIQALILGRAVDSVPQAVALADDLLAAQFQYLPRFQGDNP